MVFNVHMAKILDWRRSDDPRDVVHLAVQALVEGYVVAAPTESSYVYLASGLQPGAIEQLQRFAWQGDENALALIPRGAEEAIDFLPSIGQCARRFVSKSWPGPLVLQAENSDRYSSLHCLPENVYGRIRNQRGEVRIWLPDHEVIHYITRLVSGPLVVAVAPQVAKPETIACSVVDLAPTASVLSIDGGSIQQGGEPTVVAIDGNLGRVVREGVLSENQLRQLSQYMILMVCTGNTCRSPMAAALMRQKIQEKFPNEFRDQAMPIVVASAGVSAFGGDPASHGALEAIRSYGCSLDDHQSNQLNSRWVDQADLILAMGQRHRSVILSQWPEVASKVHLIAADGSEISDPFGGPLEVYQRCAEQLNRHTSHWLDQLDTSSIIRWSKP